MTMRKPALGIDIAKKTFDVHLLREGPPVSQHFENAPFGFDALEGSGSPIWDASRFMPAWRRQGPMGTP
jgi:hypothetical protein